MNRFIAAIIALASLLGTAIVARAQDASSNAGHSTDQKLRRSISIRAYEIFEQRKLRLYLSVDEHDASNHYFLNTLDSKSFRLNSDDANELPVEPTSLSTFANHSPMLFRETAIVFEAHQSLPAAQLEATRSAVASFLDRFRSDFLTVRASVADKELGLVSIAPGQSENPRTLQKSILESPSIEGQPGVTAGVCAALRELQSNPEKKSVSQKTLIFMSRPALDGEKSWLQLQSCLSKSNNSNIRVYWIRLHEQNPEFGKYDEAIRRSVERSGGFVSRLSSTSDPIIALKNLRSYLDDEYVLEFNLTEHQPYSDVLKFRVSANYHGNVIRSDEMAFEGFVALPRPEEIKRLEQMQQLQKIDEQRMMFFIIVFLAIMALVIVIVLKRNNAGCSKCGFRVARNFQDCPFRNQKCFGRLSVVAGPMQGAEFPLFVGQNTLGSSFSRTIRLRAKGLSRKHAKIILTQRKGLFSPEKGTFSRVNGVIATEPRLVSSGTILRMGELVCRIDFKEE